MCGWSELLEADCKNNKETLALQKFGIAEQLISLLWLQSSSIDVVAGFHYDKVNPPSRSFNYKMH